MDIKLSRITPDQNTIIDPSKLFTKNRKTENWWENISHIAHFDCDFSCALADLTLWIIPINKIFHVYCTTKWAREKLPWVPWAANRSALFVNRANKRAAGFLVNYSITGVNEKPRAREADIILVCLTPPESNVYDVWDLWGFVIMAPNKEPLPYLSSFSFL